MVKDLAISILNVKLMATLLFTVPPHLASIKTQSGLQTLTARTVIQPSFWWITETWHCLVRPLLSYGAQTHISKSLRSKRRKRKEIAAAVIVQVMKMITLKTSLSGAESVTVFSKAQNLISATNLSAETVSLMLLCKETATSLFIITLVSQSGLQTHTVSMETCTWLCKPMETWLSTTRATPARTNIQNGQATLAAWTQTVFSSCKMMEILYSTAGRRLLCGPPTPFILFEMNLISKKSPYTSNSIE